MPSDPRMRGFRQRAEVAEVEALLRARASAPLPSEEIDLIAAHGRVLTEAVTSSVDVPGFHRSAMDGYAIRGEETFGATEYSPIPLRIVGESLPGRPYPGKVGLGEAVRIATGAPIPDGADTVLMAEHAREEEHESGPRVQASRATTPGKHISRRGEDVRTGETLFAAGRRLRPQDVGLASSCGVSRVLVHRRPTVDILITGDEILPPGSRPAENRIVDANSPMLVGLVERDGGSGRVRSGIEDTAEAVREALRESEGDVIIATGGTSVGPEDHVPAAVRELGELTVHGVAMRPSSPTGVGFLDGRPVFLLPGNPVSALAAYDFFAGPTVRALGGRSREWPYRSVSLLLRHKLASMTGRVDYARVCIVDDAVKPLMTSGASILSSATRADGFVVVPRDDEGISAGEKVTVYLYG